MLWKCHYIQYAYKNISISANEPFWDLVDKIIHTDFNHVLQYRRYPSEYVNTTTMRNEVVIFDFET